MTLLLWDEIFLNIFSESLFDELLVREGAFIRI
jgi:hypothetical protein